MLDWQDLIVLTLVALAGGYLCRRVWGVFRNRAGKGCGSSCGSCSSKSTSAESTDRPVVTIDSLIQSANHARPASKVRAET